MHRKIIIYTHEESEGEDQKNKQRALRYQQFTPETNHIAKRLPVYLDLQCSKSCFGN